ncbi:hemolysin-III related [Pelotomaculum sp. FP]|uniref:PAQR family membrane homeostasis protein TrhA n=1 Tax=Pelotomaculum sp. FP TaxID=261474 RepID=UPI001100716A|nr:hemolysin III family protein [Pelotomaculum sp. FP]TEB10428.1 hemolysin-III related [Pelotomaculum sp. FP]
MNVFKMREPVNTWTHLITFALSLAGLVYLVIVSRSSAAKVATMATYGATVIILFGASSLYHWIRTSPRKVVILKKLDHAAIYLLIAGSYTPVFFYGLSGGWKWAMLAVVWFLACAGIILKMWYINAPRWVSTSFYVGLGWIALVPFIQLVRNLPSGAIALMVAGGVFYTVGAAIYATKWLNFFPNRFGFHEIFHLFVMAGSITHFIMMARYIVPL